MVRTYSVKYKSKSKMLTDAEKVEAAKKAILDETVAKSVEIKDDGQIVSIEAEEDDCFQYIMCLLPFALVEV
ncbi:MAG: hypothetical protein HP047_01150, partial [Lachnospira sp.]|nr:hypothetical protein [Lachnospira sp.]